MDFNLIWIITDQNINKRIVKKNMKKYFRKDKI